MIIIISLYVDGTIFFILRARTAREKKSSVSLRWRDEQQGGKIPSVLL